LSPRIAGQLAVELGEYTNDLTSVARTADISSGNPFVQRAALTQASNRLAVFDAGAIMLDNHGIVVGAEPERPELLGQDWSNRAYFRQMVRSPAPVLSDILNDGSRGAQVIVVAVPVTGPRGEFVGTLAGMFGLGETKFSSFYATIVKLRIGADDKAFLGAYLVDRNGQVIYHSDESYIGQDFSRQRAVQQLLSGKSDALRTRDLTGQDIVASFAPVPGTSWGLVTEVSWDVLLSASQGYRQFLLLLLALGVLIPAVVVAIGVGRITKPIVELTDAARQVAGGNFGQTVTASTGDELEDLAQQFNRMSAELAESYTQLRRRQERLEFVMEWTNDGIWDWDLATNDVYFSPRWKSILGYQDHELANRLEEWQVRIHPDDAERAMATVQAHLNGETPVYQLEHRLRHKDGSYRWILARGIAIRDASGKPYRLAGSHTDITERKRAEEDVRRQNEYLAALHETALGVMGRLDIMELLEAIVERSLRLIGASYGWVYLVAPEKDALEVKVGTGLFHQYVGLRLKPGEGLAGKVWQMGQPMAVEDYHHWSGRSQQYEKEQIGSAMGVPLKSGSEVVGITGLARTPSEPPFRQDEIDLMGRLAQLASIALENARLHTSLQVELADRVRAEQALEERLAFEQLIASISTEFINLGPDEVDAGIQHALELIAEFSEDDRSYIFQFYDDGAMMDNTHEWCRAGIEPQIHDLQAQSVEVLPWSTGKIKRQEVVHVPRVADLGPEARVDREQMQGQDIQSIILVPMVRRGSVVGFIGFDSVRVEKTWPEDIVTLLKIIGEIFVNALEHRHAQKAIQSANQTLEQRVKERTHELATLNAIAAVVSRSLDLKEILNAALDKTIELTHMDIGLAYRLEERESEALDGHYLSLLAHRGVTEEFLHYVDPLRLRGSMIEKAAHAGKPIVWLSADYPNPQVRQANQIEGIQLGVSVPLLVKGRLVGAMSLASRNLRTTTPEELSLLAAVGQQVGIAVENARLYEQAEQSAAMAERNRLARELHDSVTQSLYSVTLYAEAAARLLTAGEQLAAADHLRELRDTAQEALREMRLLIFELRPPALEKSGLVAALQARLEAVEGRGGTLTELQVEGAQEAERVPRAVQEELYQLAREALNNVLKHARAQHVRVHVQFGETVTCLEISDDGVGADLAQVLERGGLGLPGMKERAQKIGANLQVESAPGKGTRVRVTVGTGGPRELGGTYSESQVPPISSEYP
jgi:PAS domain S-box-containing protein